MLPRAAPKRPWIGPWLPKAPKAALRADGTDTARRPPTAQTPAGIPQTAEWHKAVLQPPENGPQSAPRYRGHAGLNGGP